MTQNRRQLTVDDCNRGRSNAHIYGTLQELEGLPCAMCTLKISVRRILVLENSPNGSRLVILLCGS